MVVVGMANMVYLGKKSLVDKVSAQMAPILIGTIIIADIIPMREVVMTWRLIAS